MIFCLFFLNLLIFTGQAFLEHCQFLIDQAAFLVQLPDFLGNAVILSAAAFLFLMLIALFALQFQNLLADSGFPDFKLFQHGSEPLLSGLNGSALSQQTDYLVFILLHLLSLFLQLLIQFPVFLFRPVIFLQQRLPLGKKLLSFFTDLLQAFLFFTEFFLHRVQSGFHVETGLAGGIDLLLQKSDLILQLLSPQPLSCHFFLLAFSLLLQFLQFGFQLFVILPGLLILLP